LIRSMFLSPLKKQWCLALGGGWKATHGCCWQMRCVPSKTHRQALLRAVAVLHASRPSCWSMYLCA
jgi:hypothetical protein